MPAVELDFPDIGLFTDFEATRVVLPRIGGQTLDVAFEESLEAFEGDEYPSPFGGEAISRSWQVTIRFWRREHDRLSEIIRLFDLASASSDRRLMLRPNAFDVPDMNAVEVVTVAGYRATPADGRSWDLQFVANRVAFTVAV